jgi:hypothetical protein
MVVVPKKVNPCDIVRFHCVTWDFRRDTVAAVRTPSVPKAGVLAAFTVDKLLLINALAGWHGDCALMAAAAPVLRAG